MSGFDTDSRKTAYTDANFTTDAIDEIVKDVFDELKAGRATVQSRPRDYYEVVIPFNKLPDELKQAIGN